MSATRRDARIAPFKNPPTGRLTVNRGLCPSTKGDLRARRIGRCVRILNEESCGLWAVGCGLWAVGCGLWAVGCGLWAVGCGLWAEITRRQLLTRRRKYSIFRQERCECRHAQRRNRFGLLACWRAKQPALLDSRRLQGARWCASGSSYRDRRAGWRGDCSRSA